MSQQGRLEAGFDPSRLDDLEHLRGAAERGVGHAQRILGAKYLLGQGVPYNCRQAVKWLGRAAVRGDRGAAQLLREHIERAGQRSRPEDLKLLRVAAEGRIGEAQRVLGEKYLLGCGVERDPRQAGKWLGRAAVRDAPGARQLLREHLQQTAEDSCPDHLEFLQGAAEGGVGGAQRVLGEKYISGRGVERNCQQAVKWLSLAAKCNEPSAEELLTKQIRLAARHRRPYDLELLQAGAEQGMVEAQKLLGKKYLSSSWLHRDCRQAVRWLKRATKRNEPGAWQLFRHHLQHAARHSSSSDLEFLHVAAEEGFGEAERALGEKYHSGYGVKRDYRQAGKWLGRAAERYDRCALKLVQRHLRKAAQPTRLADLEFLHGAAEGGFGRAQRMLGENYLLGRGVDCDHRQAAKWLTRSTMRKTPGAKELLVRQLQDIARSNSPANLEFLHVAAEEGFSEAQVALGKRCLLGHGIERNYRSAEQWFRRAVKRGSADALYNLGMMCLNGHSVRYHRSDALTLITGAAEGGCLEAMHHLLTMHLDHIDDSLVFDPELALKWLKIAMGFQDDKSYELRDAFSKWIVHNAEENDANAQFAVGKMCLLGIGTIKSQDKAMGWLRKSARQGHAEAARILALNSDGGPTGSAPPGSTYSADF